MSLNVAICRLKFHWDCWVVVLMLFCSSLTGLYVVVCCIVLATAMTCALQLYLYNYAKNGDVDLGDSYPLLDAFLFVVAIGTILLFEKNVYYVVYYIVFMSVYVGFARLVELDIIRHVRSFEKAISEANSNRIGNDNGDEKILLIKNLSRVQNLPWYRSEQAIFPGYLMSFLLIGVGLMVLSVNVYNAGGHPWLAVIVGVIVGINLIMRGFGLPILMSTERSLRAVLEETRKNIAFK